MDNIYLGGKRSLVATSPIPIESFSPSRSTSRYSLLPRSEIWAPGFSKNIPYLGLVCLVGALAFAVASVIVLFESDHQSQSQWNRIVAPNVILAVLSSCSALCFTIAVMQGVTISWWRRAMKGTTINDLSNTWGFSFSLFNAFAHPRSLNIAALAALAAQLCIVGGVLFQRAATTYSGLGTIQHVNVTAFSPPELFNALAAANYLGNDTDYMYGPFERNVRAWLASAYGQVSSVPDGYSECANETNANGGICALTLKAPGYTASCTTETVQADLAYYESIDVFNIQLGLSGYNDERDYTLILLNYTWSYPVEPDLNNKSSICPAVMNYQSCELRQAMIDYPIVLQSSRGVGLNNSDSGTNIKIYLGTFNSTEGGYKSPTLLNENDGQLDGFHFHHWVNETFPPDSSYMASAGIYKALANVFNSRTSRVTNSDNTWGLVGEGQWAGLMEYDGKVRYNGYSCPAAYGSPMEFILMSLNTLTFITASDYTHTMPANFTPVASRSTYLIHQDAIQYLYEIHYSKADVYMWCALGVTVLCVLLCCPVYWGFWEIGRDVSLNPIEVAAAFQSILLIGQAPKSGSVDDVLKVTGRKRVRYTTLEDPDGGSKMRFVAT